MTACSPMNTMAGLALAAKKNHAMGIAVCGTVAYLMETFIATMKAAGTRPTLARSKTSINL